MADEDFIFSSFPSLRYKTDVSTPPAIKFKHSFSSVNANGLITTYLRSLTVMIKTDHASVLGGIPWSREIHPNRFCFQRLSVSISSTLFGNHQA
jgi:hypothetical protein